MPNQLNYSQNIQNITIGDDIFRFVTPNNVVVRGIFGDGIIGLDLDREFIEINLYEQNTNNLIKSVAVPLSEGYLSIIEESEENNIQFQLKLWQPEDQNNLESNTLLKKYLNDVPPGTYDIIINFFSDELGSYNDRKWKIKKISNSRKEILLEHDTNREIDIRELTQFIDNSIFVSDFQQLMVSNFSDSNYLNQFNLSLDNDQKNVIINNNLSSNVNDIINSLLQIIYTRIDEFIDNEIINKNFRITQAKFLNTINDIINTVIYEHLNSFPVQDGYDSGEIPLFRIGNQ